LISAVLCIGCSVEMMRRCIAERTAMWMFCEHLTVAKGPLFFWSYCFYVSKYYEMLDTVLSICRRSSMPHFYFHVYHHCVVPAMVWGTLQWVSTLQHAGLVANTLTHGAMYAYYALKVAGVPTPDTYLACQRLRSETPSEGAHVFIRTPIPNLAMANIAFYRMQPLDSAALDEQLRVACEGFRCLFQPWALRCWWHASSESVRDVVKTLAKHAQNHAELWQLTFDVIALCFYCVPDWQWKAELAEQVLMWLALCPMSHKNRLYGCRCIMYCQPFRRLKSLHHHVLERIQSANKDFTQESEPTRFYLRLTAQSAICLWELEEMWYLHWCGHTIAAALFPELRRMNLKTVQFAKDVLRSEKDREVGCPSGTNSHCFGNPPNSPWGKLREGRPFETMTRNSCILLSFVSLRLHPRIRT